MSSSNTTYPDFLKSEIRVGRVVEAHPNERARVPCHILKIDFGGEIGLKSTSAQIVDRYPDPADLVGRQIAAVVNLQPKRIAGFNSEVLLLAAVTSSGSILLHPDQPTPNGSPVR